MEVSTKSLEETLMGAPYLVKGHIRPGIMRHMEQRGMPSLMNGEELYDGDDARFVGRRTIVDEPRDTLFVGG